MGESGPQDEGACGYPHGGRGSRCCDPVGGGGRGPGAGEKGLQVAAGASPGVRCEEGICPAGGAESAEDERLRAGPDGPCWKTHLES